MTHCTSLKLACSSDWMVGKATITMVMSNSNMKVAAHTTTKVHHFFSMTCSLRRRTGRPPQICRYLHAFDHVL